MKKQEKKTQAIVRKTHKLDAQDKILGRLATRIVTLLRGKHKVSFQPYIDGGDCVIVTNVRDIKITGAKLDQKKYYHYSGYPGGMKVKQLGHLMEKDPAAVLRRVVYQMLPPTKHRKSMIKRLIIES